MKLDRFEDTGLLQTCSANAEMYSHKTGQCMTVKENWRCPHEQFQPTL